MIISSPAFIDRLIRDNILMECKDKIIGLFSSGGPLSDISAIRLFEQLGIAATQIYGSTETVDCLSTGNAIGKDCLAVF